MQSLIIILICGTCDLSLISSAHSHTDHTSLWGFFLRQWGFWSVSGITHHNLLVLVYLSSVLLWVLKEPRSGTLRALQHSLRIPCVRLIRSFSHWAVFPGTVIQTPHFRIWVSSHPSLGSLWAPSSAHFHKCASLHPGCNISPLITDCSLVA